MTTNRVGVSVGSDAQVEVCDLADDAKLPCSSLKLYDPTGKTSANISAANPLPTVDSAANVTLAAILAKLESDAATETTLQAIEALLTSLLAAVATAAAQGTGNASLASIKGDLDTIAAAVSTAAAQATGNAHLSTISASLTALAAANHSDLDTLHGDLASILAKVTSAAATEVTAAATLAALTNGTQVAKVRPAAVTTYGGASSWPTQGQQIGSGALSLLYVEATNGIPATSIYFQVFDRTSAPTAGDRPLWAFTSIISTGTTLGMAVGHSVWGLPCVNGAWGVFSSTLTQYTPLVSTAVTVYTGLYSAP